MAQAPTLSRAIRRGPEAPLPFDDEIFDPTPVVSNPPTAPQSTEITHVLSKCEDAFSRAAGIAMGTSAIPTSNIPIPILDLLGSNIVPPADHFDRNLDPPHYGEVRIGTPEPDRAG